MTACSRRWAATRSSCRTAGCTPGVGAGPGAARAGHATALLRVPGPVGRARSWTSRWPATTRPTSSRSSWPPTTSGTGPRCARPVRRPAWTPIRRCPTSCGPRCRRCSCRSLDLLSPTRRSPCPRRRPATTVPAWSIGDAGRFAGFADVATTDQWVHVVAQQHGRAGMPWCTNGSTSTAGSATRSNCPAVRAPPPRRALSRPGGTSGWCGRTSAVRSSRTGRRSTCGTAATTASRSAWRPGSPGAPAGDPPDHRAGRRAPRGRVGGQQRRCVRRVRAGHRRRTRLRSTCRRPVRR